MNVCVSGLNALRVDHSQNWTKRFSVVPNNPSTGLNEHNSNHSESQQQEPLFVKTTVITLRHNNSNYSASQQQQPLCI